jgi:hypothetical protein
MGNSNRHTANNSHNNRLTGNHRNSTDSRHSLMAISSRISKDMRPCPWLKPTITNEV